MVAVAGAVEDAVGLPGLMVMPWRRRVHAELARRGVRAGLELVRVLMRQLGLAACQLRAASQARAQGRFEEFIERAAEHYDALLNLDF